MKVYPWRGILAAASWLVWPAAFMLANFPTQCDVDNCGPPEPWWHTALWLAALVGPPILATAAWLRWRDKYDERAA